ncbi:MAG: hypothetical protein LC776_05430 [Acidobacteria bacterium]|nr:hypothetical protein [Acidobacteriota bacterium]
MSRENTNLLLNQAPDDPDVTFSGLVELCESLLLLWNNIRRNVNEFRNSTYGSLCPDEKLYFDTLSRYVTSVRDSVVLLAARQRLINEEGNASSSKNLDEKEKQYQDAVRRHKSIAQEFHALGAFFVEPEDENDSPLQPMCEIHQTRLRHAKVRLLLKPRVIRPFLDLT